MKSTLDNSDHIRAQAEPALMSQAGPRRSEALAAWLRRRRIAVLLALVVGWYGLATLP